MLLFNIYMQGIASGALSASPAGGIRLQLMHAAGDLLFEAGASRRRARLRRRRRRPAAAAGPPPPPARRRRPPLFDLAARTKLWGKGGGDGNQFTHELNNSMQMSIEQLLGFAK